MVTKSEPTTFDKIELGLKILAFSAFVSVSLWALYLYQHAGKDDWKNNISLETKVFPYRGDLRLLVVHVKSKNPRNFRFALDREKGDSFDLRIQNIPMDEKEGAVFSDDDTPNLIKAIDILGDNSGIYQFLPNAEMNDMYSIVLPVNSIVQLTADMNIHNGLLDEDGKPDTDYVSGSTVVRIEP